MSIYQRDPAAPGANVRRRELGPVEGRLEGAVASFNASAAARVVAGLTRSLGRPRASVGAAAGSATGVRVTVAWELCWYQWSVDTVDGAVREVGKGEAVAQLDSSARHWNAAVTKGGVLAFGAAGLPPRRRGWLRRR
ncbi:MAG TPA: hypothetical protein VG898_06910 [Solirubrobacterales bacterium]|nr:hypothetical protein [Solirubrobacterales bacterium]